MREIDEALEAWGVAAAEVVPLAGGAVNEHWRIEAEAGPRVLRRYHPAHRPEATPYEHAALAHLAALDWPVAAPIAAAGGETAVETPAGRWSLFPFLEGSPAPASPRALGRKGAVLALLHADLAAWPGGAAQRPTFARVSELDVYLESRGETTVAAVARRLDPSHGRALARIRERNLRDLARGGYGALPDTVIYSECLGANVLFEGNDVSGLLDFDFVHRDARVADIGRSLVVDCGIDTGRVAAWLRGYAAHASPALSPAEVDLLPAMMVANALWNAVLPLALAGRYRDAHHEGLAAGALRAIDEGLPALEDAAEPLRAAAWEAARPH